MCQCFALINILAICFGDKVTTVHVSIFALAGESTIIICAVGINSTNVSVAFVNIGAGDSFFRIMLLNKIALHAFTVIATFFAFAIFMETILINTNLEVTRTWVIITLIDIFTFIIIVSGKTRSALYAIVSADGVGAFFIGVAFEATVLTFIDVFTWCSRAVTTMTGWT